MMPEWTTALAIAAPGAVDMRLTMTFATMKPAPGKDLK